ncbi:hypothetical protein BM735_00520 [Erysipelotrichaceae bacterium NYU-BL-F16]|uniref:Uncharacterized protein n=1 Tax=Ileibacterium valens TaxID=1862668 RepID=A0A1U7NGV4_9FIRM|nr:hypothetical protein BO222_04620 [Ileibacterium valens]OLU43306.1 hypothetical protein BM735_00520 [Erysipelotrichaceae bacterium NYU-BL-F16]
MTPESMIWKPWYLSADAILFSFGNAILRNISSKRRYEFKHVQCKFRIIFTHEFKNRNQSKIIS